MMMRAFGCVIASSKNLPGWLASNGENPSNRSTNPSSAALSATRGHLRRADVAVFPNRR
jgi:hypothetical protein